MRDEVDDATAKLRATIGEHFIKVLNGAVTKFKRGEAGLDVDDCLVVLLGVTGQFAALHDIAVKDVFEKGIELADAVTEEVLDEVLKGGSVH